VTAGSEPEPVVVGRDIKKHFKRQSGEMVQALDGVSLEVAPGSLAALVGPDGAGKTTLLRLMTGLLEADSGELRVLGLDVASDPQAVQSRIAYMPQRFGLYEDLTVQENLDLYADLNAVSKEERRTTYPRLMEMTALGPFTRRLAGQLSGGMKQKLGLACTLVRSPDLLLLDEPTVGVDPLSRRELWDILRHLVNDEHLSVLMSTSYLDEAQWCQYVLVMYEGRVLARGAPQEVSALASGLTYLAEPAPGQKARDLQAALLDEPGIADAVPEGGFVRVVSTRRAKDGGLRAVKMTPTPPRFEDGFMILLREATSAPPEASDVAANAPTSADAAGRARAGQGTLESLAGKRESNRDEAQLVKGTTAVGTVAGVGLGEGRREAKREPEGKGQGEGSADEAADVHVRDLVRRFGTFTAVDHITFEVRRGEIFGLLGPNGAGKTTTFRMLCGLLPATSGTLMVAGIDVRKGQASARRRLGYVAQKFSLYGQLSVTDNLEFFGGAYGLQGDAKRERVAWALRQFDLEPLAALPAGRLPGGFKQRLAMAAALLHQPDTLFLDEPTSGADPQARRDFWRRITLLAGGGVTTIVTTHFMEEAEYCDHIAVMDAGRILAQGTPAEIRRHARPAAGQEATMEDAFIAIVGESRSALQAAQGPFAGSAA
jgi:ABC-2 type transport system ATP-binding protein